MSIFKRANKILLKGEIMISDDLHLHTENCPRKANLLEWANYEIKKYSHQIQNLTNKANIILSSQNAQKDFYFRIQDLLAKNTGK